MSDILYENVIELKNQYNAILFEYGIEVTIHRRSFTNEVREYCFRPDLIDLLEYKFIRKK